MLKSKFQTGRPDTFRGGRFFFAALIAAAGLLLVTPCNAQLDPIVAVVDRLVVTERDLDFQMFEFRLYDPALWSAPDEVIQEDALQEVIEEMLLYQEFWKAELEPPEGEMSLAAEEAWDRYVELAGSVNMMQSYVDQGGFTKEAVRKWLEVRAERQWYIRLGLSARLNPELMDRADDNASSADRIRFSHLYAAPKVPQDPSSWEDAEARATEAWYYIAGGEPFDRATAIFSDDDKTAGKGGELGWMECSTIETSLLESLRTLDLDEVSSPVRSTLGYHLLKLEDFETEVREELARQMEEVELKALEKARSEREVVLSDGYALSWDDVDVPDQALTVWDSILKKAEEEAEDLEEK